jgi:hypothetical protein
VPHRVREVAIQREARIAHQRIDAEMQPLDRLAPARRLLECAVELREVQGSAPR